MWRWTFSALDGPGSAGAIQGPQLIQAAQVCHNMLAHPAALAPTLDQLQVLIAASAARTVFTFGYMLPQH